MFDGSALGTVRPSRRLVILLNLSDMCLPRSVPRCQGARLNSLVPIALPLPLLFDIPMYLFIRLSQDLLVSFVFRAYLYLY